MAYRHDMLHAWCLSVRRGKEQRDAKSCRGDGRVESLIVKTFYTFLLRFCILFGQCQGQWSNWFTFVGKKRFYLRRHIGCAFVACDYITGKRQRICEFVWIFQLRAVTVYAFFPDREAMPYVPWSAPGCRTGNGERLSCSQGESGQAIKSAVA